MSFSPSWSAVRRFVILFVVVGLSATACGEGSPDSEVSALTPIGDVRELMASVVEPAAETYWDAVGWIVDSTGTEYIRPTTLEEWEAVRNSAFALAESGNLMMMEGRAPDEGAWMGMTRAMMDAAVEAIAVAEARDEQGVFDMGATIYATCTNCHARYATETLRPNAQLD